MKKGFTLIEILIVMAIIAILIALGAGGMILWRENTEASQATQEVLAVLKEIQTKAKNNTIPTDHIQDANEFALVNSRNYGFFIHTENGETNKLTYQICWKNINAYWSEMSCLPQKYNLIPERYSNIEFNAMLEDPMGVTTCDFSGGNGIIIENLTGMIVDNHNGYIQCDISIRIISQKIDYSYINFNRNNIQRVYEFHK